MLSAIASIWLPITKLDKVRLQRLQIMGVWTDAQQGQHFQDPLAGNCFHSGKQMDTVLHLWKCEGIKQARAEADAELAEADVDKIPAHILLGVPSIRPAEPSSTLCPILDQGAGGWCQLGLGEHP